MPSQCHLRPCPKWNSNPHTLSGMRLRSARVYQFRHSGTSTKTTKRSSISAGSSRCLGADYNRACRYSLSKERTQHHSSAALGHSWRSQLTSEQPRYCYAKINSDDDTQMRCLRHHTRISRSNSGTNRGHLRRMASAHGRMGRHDRGRRPSRRLPLPTLSEARVLRSRRKHPGPRLTSRARSSAVVVHLRSHIR